MKMTNFLETFQNRFSYRQRFIIFALIFFLGMPLPTYWTILQENYHIRVLERKLTGIEYQKALESLLYLVIWHHLDLSSPSEVQSLLILDSNDKIQTEIDQKINILDELNADPSPPIPKRPGVGFSQSPDASIDINSIKNIWKEILIRESGQIQSNTTPLYEQLIQQILNLLKQTIWNFELAITLDSMSRELIQASSISLPELKVAAFNLYNRMRQGALPITSSDSLVLRILLSDIKIKQRAAEEVLENNYMLDERKGNIPSATSVYAQDSLKRFREAALNFTQEIYRVSQGTSTLSPIPISTYLRANERCWKINANIIQQRIADKLRFYKLQLNAFLILISVSGLIVAFYLFFHVLSHHFLELYKHIQELAKGNFSKCFCSDARDGFGSVGKAFDKMGQSVQEIVTELKKLGQQLFDSIAQITKTAETQEGTVARQEHHIKEIGETAKMIATNSRGLATTMNDLNQSSRENSFADLAKDSLNHIIHKMDELNISSERIMQRLESLLEKVSSMRSVIAFMARVSDQAGLLSLNAAIETTTVGSEKQSFNKITQEIQRFAEKTAISTKQIEQIIKEMSKNVSRVKNETKTCLKEMNDGAQRLVFVDEQIKAIFNQGKEQIQKFESVNDVMQVQAFAAENIIESISKLSQSAEDNTQCIRQLHGATQELGVTAKELQKVLTLFFHHELGRS